MRVKQQNIKVLIASKSHGNPYEPDEEALALNTGLYCETVMNTRRPLRAWTPCRTKTGNEPRHQAGHDLLPRRADQLA